MEKRITGEAMLETMEARKETRKRGRSRWKVKKRCIGVSFNSEIVD